MRSFNPVTELITFSVDVTRPFILPKALDTNRIQHLYGQADVVPAQIQTKNQLEAEALTS